MNTPTPTPAAETVAGAIAQLRTHQKQLDPDGCMVGVSRQALDEVLAAIEATRELPASAPKAEGDNRLPPDGEGLAWIRRAYHGEGPYTIWNMDVAYAAGWQSALTRELPAASLGDGLDRLVRVGDLPARLTHSQAWPQGFVDGWNEYASLVEKTQSAPAPSSAGEGDAHVFNCARCPVSVIGRYETPDCPECGDPTELDQTAKPEAGAVGDGEVDLFWDADHAERARESIAELVRDRWDDGAENGEVITIHRAIRLPNIEARIMIIGDGEPGYSYEILPTAAPEMIRSIGASTIKRAAQAYLANVAEHQKGMEVDHFAMGKAIEAALARSEGVA